MPSGSSVTYSAAYVVSAGASGTLSNTATVSSAAVPDPNPANGSATDTTSIVSGQELIVNGNGTGAGTVTSAPEGVNCGLACSAWFPCGQSVILTAEPAAGSGFSGWLGSGCGGPGLCELVMTESRLVWATFDSCDLVLGSMILWGAESFTACNLIVLDNGLVVEYTGDVSFRAATMVVLKNGARFTQGATVKIGVDQSGGSRFGGQSGRVSVFNTALIDGEIAKLAQTPREQALPRRPELLISTTPVSKFFTG